MGRASMPAFALEPGRYSRLRRYSLPGDIDAITATPGRKNADASRLSMLASPAANLQYAYREVVSAPTESNDASLFITPVPKSLQRAQIQLFVFMCLAAVTFGGATFGWGPMQIILEENGNYGYLCTTDSANVADVDVTTNMGACPEQTSSLLLVITITSFVFITAPLWGYLIDHRGPFLGMILSAFLVWIGLSCLTAATFLPGPSMDPLLYVAFACLMCVSTLCNILIIHVGLVFDKPESTQRAISVLNTLFDSGALTYLILYQISLSVESSWVFIGYLGSSVVIYVGAVWSWQRVLKKESKRHDCLGNGDKEAIKENAGGQQDKGCSSQPKLSLQDICIIAAEDGSEGAESGADDFQDNDLCLKNKPLASKTAASNTQDGSSGSSNVPISELPPSRQLRTRMFVLHAIFFGIVGARNTFVLATAKGFLEYLGDDDYLYLRIFTLMQPVSILGLPLMNWIINTKGYHAALQCINILGLAHGIIQVSATNLNVQVLGFVIFSVYRCFVFSVCFGFLPTYLGMRVVGRGAGILTLAQGIMCAVNIPLGAVAINRLDGNFFWPNLAYTFASVPCVLMAWYIGGDIQRNQEAKENHAK